jgi:hypothetical protein
MERLVTNQTSCTGQTPIWVPQCIFDTLITHRQWLLCFSSSLMPEAGVGTQSVNCCTLKQLCAQEKGPRLRKRRSHHAPDQTSKRQESVAALTITPHSQRSQSAAAACCSGERFRSKSAVFVPSACLQNPTCLHGNSRKDRAQP